MNVSQIDHSGKTVFVGIDVHKKTYAMAAVGDHLPEVVKFGNLRASPSELVTKLRTSFPGATLKTVYEAGFAGYVLHRTLEKAGIVNIVVNPASIETAANNRVKNDKRDARKMALHLSKDMLIGNRIPSEQEELERLYHRTRDQIVGDRARTGCRIKAKLFQFGLIPPEDDRVMSDKLLSEFLALKMPPELSDVLNVMARVYRDLSREIKTLEGKMRELAETHTEVEVIYQSVPGIGFITSRVFSSELGNMSQFKNEKQLFSFLGLTPSEFSSGESEKRGRITKQGSAALRSALVEISWRAIRLDDGLAATYNRIKARSGGKRAIVAIARRLSGKMRACQLSKRKYENRPSSRLTKLGTRPNTSRTGASTVEDSTPVAARSLAGAAPYVEVKSGSSGRCLGA